MQPIPEAFVIGIHNKMLMPTPHAVGPCIFCDEVVYLSGEKGVGELGLHDYKDMVKKKLIGMECFLDALLKFIAMLSLPKEMREEVVNYVLEQQKRFN